MKNFIQIGDKKIKISEETAKEFQEQFSQKETPKKTPSKIEVYESFCCLKRFTINGIEAEYEDFGCQYDNDEENTCDYGCGDMRFFPNKPTKEVLNKYKINKEEYSDICDELEEKLSFGECDLCS